MTPTTFQRVTYAALLAVMLGVATGLVGGL